MPSRRKQRRPLFALLSPDSFFVAVVVVVLLIPVVFVRVRSSSIVLPFSVFLCFSAQDYAERKASAGRARLAYTRRQAGTTFPRNDHCCCSSGRTLKPNSGGLDSGNKPNLQH